MAAREKTIKEQCERVAKLEKTVKDMQALLDLKSNKGADLQKQAAGPQQPETKAGKPPMPAKPSMPEPAKPELPAPPAQTLPAEPPMAAERAPEAAPGASMAQSGTAAAPTAQAKPKPARKPKTAAASTSAPAPQSLVDQILNEPLYLAAGAAGDSALLGFLGFRMIEQSARSRLAKTSTSRLKKKILT